MRPTSVGGGSQRMLPPLQPLVPRAVQEHQTGRAANNIKIVQPCGCLGPQLSLQGRVAFSVTKIDDDGWDYALG